MLNYNSNGIILMVMPIDGITIKNDCSDFSQVFVYISACNAHKLQTLH